MKTTILILILLTAFYLQPLASQPAPWPERMVPIEETTDGGSTWKPVQDPSDNVNPANTNIQTDGIASAFAKVIGSDVFFRVVLKSSPETFGGLAQFVWTARFARYINGAWTYVAEAGVNGKPTGYSDKVYASNAAGTIVNDVYDVFTGQMNQYYGARVIPFTYQETTLYYLDWQVPFSALQAVDPDLTSITPVKLYFLTASDNNNDNKDHFRCADVCEVDWNGLRIYQFNDISLPVELVSFSAHQRDGEVVLAWKTATETNNQGFEIQRAGSGKEWEPIGFVPGAGTVSSPQTYYFVDRNPLTGKITYRLKQIDRDGTTDYSEAIVVNAGQALSAPQILALYPNPFNPTAKITYSLPRKQKVTVEMIDILGRVVRTFLEKEQQETGTHNVQIDGTNLGSGTYFVTVRSDDFTMQRKVLLLK